MDEISLVSSESHSACKSDAASDSNNSCDVDNSCEMDKSSDWETTSESESSSESSSSSESEEANYESDSTNSHSSNASIRESDSDDPEPSTNLQLLKILASKVQNDVGNYVLHQFVLDFSNPSDKSNEAYVNAVLVSMCDIGVNDYNEDGYAALHLAVLQNSAFMVKKLLSCLKNIDINLSCNIIGTPTALHLAIRCGHLAIVKELLQQGCDVNKTNGYGCTPLFEAESACNSEVVELLLENGANVNAKSNNGETVLLQAAMGGSDNNEPFRRPIFGDRSEIMKLLLKGGAEVNAVGKLLGCPLHYAVKFNFYKGVKLLLENQALVNEVDVFRWTPLHYAAKSCGVGIVKLLLDSGAEVNAKNMDGCTPLHMACQREKPFVKHFQGFSGRFGVIELLLERGGDLHAYDDNNYTPLHFAVEASDVGVAKLLIRKGADVNARQWRRQDLPDTGLASLDMRAIVFSM